jgi:hypothetical protein
MVVGACEPLSVPLPLQVILRHYARQMPEDDHSEPMRADRDDRPAEAALSRSPSARPLTRVGR